MRNVPGVDVVKLANFIIKMPFLVFDIRNIACLSIFYDLEWRNDILRKKLFTLTSAKGAFVCK